MPKKNSVQKIVEDKTFGMKNKNKSSKMQKYIQDLQKSASSRSGFEDDDAKRARKKAEKEAKEKEAKEMNDLFKAVMPTQKIPTGTDPKSILCEFFKKGACTKGAKCKFGHFTAQQSLSSASGGQKSAKIDLYTDPRDVRGPLDASGKQPAYQTSDIICKHFLEAVEEKKYGYFWVCPEGGHDCKYRHALPPGYVLTEKKEKVVEDEDTPKKTIEEEIEEARAELIKSGKAVTPCTLENFHKWKEAKKKRKEEEAEKKRLEAAKTGGKGLSVLSGRDLFTYDPSLFVDDDEAFDMADYAMEEDAPSDDDDDQSSGSALYDVSGQDADVDSLDVAVSSVNLNSSSSSSSAASSSSVSSSSADLFLDDVGDLPSDEEDDDDDEDDDESDDEPAAASSASVSKKK